MPVLNLTAKLGLDGRGFQNEFNKTTANIGGDLKRSIAGAFTVGAVMAAAKGISDHILHIKDLSEQYRITTDQAQKMQMAGRKTGLGDEFLNVLPKIRQSRKEAVESNAELESVYRKAKIPLSDLNSARVSEFDILQRLSSAMRENVFTAREQEVLEESLGIKAYRLQAAMRELANVDLSGWGVRSDDIERWDELAKKMDVVILKAKGLAAGTVLEAAGGKWYDPRKFLLSHWIYSADKRILEMLLGDGESGTPIGPGLPGSPGPGSAEVMAGLKSKADDEMFQRKKKIEEEKKLYTEIAQLQEKIFGMQLKTMDVESQRSEILSKIDDLFADAEEAQLFSDNEGMLKDYNQIAELTGLLEGTMGKPYKQHLNQLQAIGGYAGANIGGNAVDQSIRAEARSIRDKLSEIVNAVKHGGGWND